jgi:1,4-dihydroxy-2-naphthoate octaprenyltransferase|tara:strand:+ start:4109 stop:4306 length:198 start_codon:yes stop_codon:yes gene_type:complete
MPKKKNRKKVIKKKSLGPDALTLALYLISFILIVFGAWYHKMAWLLLGFIPFLVAIWYEYMKHNL